MLLLRLHHMVTGPARRRWPPGACATSRCHPDIRELYLAADVLVTDYSSAMFDFAVTGKPMLFFTYDLEDYRDRLRGFYFDFEREAPGPAASTTTPELARRAARPAGGRGGPHADRYAAFRERFCHLEDGHATDRSWIGCGVRRRAGAAG